MGKEQIETTFSKEEIDLLRLIIVDRKSYCFSQINSLHVKIDRERASNLPAQNFIDTCNARISEYQTRLNVLSKFYEFLIKWG